jgi:hypothetical protein
VGSEEYVCVGLEGTSYGSPFEREEYRDVLKRGSFVESCPSALVCHDHSPFAVSVP